jgi:hypothetical protein
MTRPSTRDLLRGASVYHLVEVAPLLARGLGLTAARGTVAAERDGVYTSVLA